MLSGRSSKPWQTVRATALGIGSLPLATMTKSRHETRYEEKDREMLLVAHALVAAKLPTFDLSPRERPDFELRLGAYSVGVEVAELIDP